MNQQLVIVGLVILFLLSAMLSANSKGKKILCTFRGANKQKQEKWIKLTDDHVVFDSHKYDVIPSCLTHFLYNRGLHQFLPIWVMSADYVYDSRFPIDPNTGKPCVMSPQVIKVMNNQDRMASFARGVSNQSGKKQSKFLDYVPWIALVGLVMFAFYQYQMNQGFNKMLADIGNQLHAIIK